MVFCLCARGQACLPAGRDFRLTRGPVRSFVVAVGVRYAPGISFDARCASARWPSAKLASNLSKSLSPENEIKKEANSLFFNLARGQGFEPRLPGPEPGVLPLDDPRI